MLRAFEGKLPLVFKALWPTIPLVNAGAREEPLLKGFSALLPCLQGPLAYPCPLSEMEHGEVEE